MSPSDTPRRESDPDEGQEKKPHASRAIGERFDRWACMGVLRGHATRTIQFRVPIEIFSTIWFCPLRWEERDSRLVIREAHVVS